MSLTVSPEKIEITHYDAAQITLSESGYISGQLLELIDAQAEAFLVNNKDHVRERLAEQALHPYVRMTRPFTRRRRLAKQSDARIAAGIERFNQEPPVITPEDRRTVYRYLHDFTRPETADEPFYSLEVPIEHASTLMGYYALQRAHSAKQVEDAVDAMKPHIKDAPFDDAEIVRLAKDLSLGEEIRPYLKHEVYMDQIDVYSRLARMGSEYQERYASYIEELRWFGESVAHA